MARLAGFMIVLGFGSLVLNLFGWEFTLLSWADDYQPWVGIGIGVVGVLIFVIKALAGRSEAAPVASTDAPAQDAQAQ